MRLYGFAHAKSDGTDTFVTCEIVTDHSTAFAIMTNHGPCFTPGEKEPTAGKYALPPMYGGADYHHVSVDIQMYTQDADGLVRACYHAVPHRVEIPRSVLLPLSSVALEGVTFPCPHDATAYLVATYGDISPTAVFDPATGLYRTPKI